MYCIYCTYPESQIKLLILSFLLQSIFPGLCSFSSRKTRIFRCFTSLRIVITRVDQRGHTCKITPLQRASSSPTLSSLFPHTLSPQQLISPDWKFHSIGGPRLRIIFIVCSLFAPRPPDSDHQPIL
jgi:hypothetical protein